MTNDRRRDLIRRSQRQRQRTNGTEANKDHERGFSLTFFSLSPTRQAKGKLLLEGGQFSHVLHLSQLPMPSALYLCLLNSLSRPALTDHPPLTTHHHSNVGAGTRSGILVADNSALLAGSIQRDGTRYLPQGDQAGGEPPGKVDGGEWRERILLHGRAHGSAKYRT